MAVFSSLIPFVGVMAMPVVFLAGVCSMYAISWTAYLLLAQQDIPSYVAMAPPPLAQFIPFVPFLPYRCYKVTRAIILYTWTCLCNLHVLSDWLQLYVHASKAGEADALYCVSMPYAIPFSDKKKLDIFPVRHKKIPGLSQRNSQQTVPVLVFVPFPIVPLTASSHRKVYLQVARTMSSKSYCVVIPDITYYPKARIRESVVDLRLALSWVGANISSYGGDPSRIYLMGFRNSAHLVLLTLIQEAVVLSRALTTHHHSSSPRQTEKSLRNMVQSGDANAAAHGALHERIKGLEIYVPQVRLPPLAGVVLLAGITDVVKAYQHELDLGIEHISFLRRAVGPAHDVCLLHSPTHLLVESRGILDAAFLPPKFLLLHGGKDAMVSIDHATLLSTLLKDAGVGQVDLRAYRNLGHTDTLTSLLGVLRPNRSSYASQICDDLNKFLV
ncbi:hypothetical protein MVES1_000584 [Malassezia vespertilionis]|uniref:BD-FAE-like domain-containing protein n=1 Tax=Malassezia vespertilionis TaxID=2020962 RepID=A0A2N1JFP8_9BASI|nr:uncharacterized protein MVES1_000584 [Malassezia vespertilionis]PKI85367.1 hypothetical protein MVES_000541 [Malassezia vespertilionis]WFD05256.1 hypothetical protein MVES1_000584 [Malassezia vespertilionis]